MVPFPTQLPVATRRIQQMYVNAKTGVVLADRAVDDGGSFERTFAALDLQTRLPEELFTWCSTTDRE